MGLHYYGRLDVPLSVALLTTEGKLLGNYKTTSICDNGFFIDGQTNDLLDTLRLLGVSICVAEVQIPHQRPLRSVVRVGLHAANRGREASRNIKVFLRFARINSDYKKRYEEFLYAAPVASL